MQAESLRICENMSIKSKAIKHQLAWFSEDVCSLCTSVWKSQREVLSSIDLIDSLLRPYGKSICILVLNQETGTQNYTSSKSNSYLYRKEGTLFLDLNPNCLTHFLSFLPWLKTSFWWDMQMEHFKKHLK